MRSCWLVLSTLIIAANGALATPGDDTTFTYQGDLKEDGQPANGVFDMTFSLWDAVSAGNQIGSSQIVEGVSVTEGRFTVGLDFGAIAFDNSERWLEVVVDATTLSPRQPITRAPYSIQTRGIFVDDAGRVGIGTSAPAGKVDLVAAAEHDAGEIVLQCGVSDASGDFLRVRNSTGNNNQFIPLIWGHHQTDDREVMETIASTDPSQDVGSRAMMTFSASQSDGSVFGGPIVNRPLFQWLNAGDPLMTIAADGRVGIGTTSPQATLNLDLPANSNEGIFLSKAGTSHGSSMTVSGSNNQIFRINVDPNDVSGYEQFDITYNSTPVFTIDRYGEVATPFTVNNSIGVGTSDYVGNFTAPGQPSGTAGAKMVIKNEIGNYFALYHVSDALLSGGLSPGGGAFWVSDLGSVWMWGALRIKQWSISQSTQGDDDLGFSFGTTGNVAEIDRNTGYYRQLSDRRVKKNIEPMNNVLSAVTRLKPVRFHHNQQEDDAPRSYGFIAQDVQQHFPDIVDTSGNGTLSLAYSNFGILAIKAIQEQQVTIETQQAEISDLTARLARLEAMVGMRLESE